MGDCARLIYRMFRRHERSDLLDATTGYDLWSRTYDVQRDNVLIALDQALFEGLLRRVQVTGRRVVDVGCGTGRHWASILARAPTELVGYDVSPGMLARLKQKYPSATVHHGAANALAHTRDGSCDLLVSTLAFSHFPSAAEALDEWVRILSVGGDVLLTDVHPEVAARSATTFCSGSRTMTIRRSVIPLATLQATAAERGLQLQELAERALDESGEHLFRTVARASEVFDRIRGLPFLYAMHLRKVAKPQ